MLVIFFVRVSDDVFLSEMSLLHQRLVQTKIAPSPPTIPQDDNTSTTSPTSNGSFDVGAGKFYFILLQTQSHMLFLAAGMGNEDDDDNIDYLLSNNMNGGHDRPLDPDVFSIIPDDDEDPGQTSDARFKEERSVMPHWLKTDYANTRERLAREMKSNASRKPTCYDRETFLDGAVSPFFASHRKFQPMPEDFYKPRYFIWIPHLLAGRIPCPSCRLSGRKNSQNTPVLLQAKGWPKAPRRIGDPHNVTGWLLVFCWKDNMSVMRITSVAKYVLTVVSCGHFPCHLAGQSIRRQQMQCHAPLFFTTGPRVESATASLGTFCFAFFLLSSLSLVVARFFPFPTIAEALAEGSSPTVAMKSKRARWMSFDRATHEKRCLQGIKEA